MAGTTPTPIVVRPKQLPVGPAPKVPWLIDNVLHKANGHKLTLPWSKAGARAHLVRLIGHTNQGWAVKSFSGGYKWSLWLIRNGEKHLISENGVFEGEVVGYQASRDQQRLLIHFWDGDDTTTITVLDLDGNSLGSEDFGGIGEVLDFRGPDLVVGTEDTRRWNVDDKTDVLLGGDAAGADIGHNLLFSTDSATGKSGPTALDSPGTPDWTAAMYQPSVSPDGKRVVSRNKSRGHIVTVRNVATGAPQAIFDIRYPATETPRWETNTSFVFVASADGGLGDQEVLVRCRLNGNCQRVSPIAPRDVISLVPR